MLNLISSAKIRFFTLFIAIISLFLSASAQAQETPLTILGEPLVTETADGNMSFQVEVSNEGPTPTNLTYGVEVRTTDEEGILIDVGGGQNITTSESYGSKVLTFTYPIPSWLNGEYDVFVTLRATAGGLLVTKIVDTIVFNGVSPEIEILTDTCVFNENDNKFPLSEHITTSEEGALTITCLVRNNTDTEQTITPNITAFAPTLHGTDTGSWDEEQTTLPAEETKEIIFTLQSPKADGPYGIRLSLNTDATTNTVVAENLRNTPTSKEDTVKEETGITKDTQNTALVALITLLSLGVLLAILVYRRKQHETLPVPEMEIDNQEN